jgi:signal transduction histidine kinase
VPYGRDGGIGPAMLGRLGVQQKLSLLLTLPLAAVVVTSVPFAVSRIDDAIAANATVSAASDARQVGFLIQDLQQERLLGLTYLIATDAERSAYVAQAAATADRAADVAGRLASPAGDDLRRRIGELDSLGALRRSVLARSTTVGRVYDSYHERIDQLIAALRLTQQPRADATGLRQMAALEALLRTNEETSRIGAGLVMSAVDGRHAARLVTEAQTLRAIEASRFREQASADQAALLDLVDQGPSAERMRSFIEWVTSGGGAALPLADLLSAAQTSITLARALQERIARDIAVRAEQRAVNARLATVILVGLTVLLVLGVIWLGFVVSRSVARPLRRLTTAAGAVADLASGELIRVADSETSDVGPPKLSAVDVRTSDEIGELALAFNRVQATAALLMEQQVATRRNVAVMFANIARRTRSLVARQLSFIDELERNERNENMLAKLYRLDHLTTRLRRSADSLFVVSGVREDDSISGTAPLVDVIRSAVAEIEGYQAVKVGAICEVTILPQLVPDLRLLLAELLENATAFSPPGAPVEVTADLVDGCRITIVDHGIGIADERLVEENERLVRRERLDIAPTSVLGLFVVGRLARRHRLRVRLAHTPAQGVTAQISVPLGLYTVDRRSMIRLTPPPAAVAALALPGQKAREPAAPDKLETETQELIRVPDLSVPPPSQDEAFAWFSTTVALPAAAPVTSTASTASTASTGEARGPRASGLRRRQPGVHLAAFGPEPPPTLTPAVPGALPPGRDPGLERSEVEAFVFGAQQAELVVQQPLVPFEPPPLELPPAPLELAPLEPAPFEPAPFEPAPFEPAPLEPLPGSAPRGGLTRRVPGAHLPEALQAELSNPDGRRPGAAAQAPRPNRDPDAERTELDSFLAGLARAAEVPNDTTNP